MLLPRLADLFVLQPTRHAVPVVDKARHEIAREGVRFEVWIQRRGQAARPDMFVLKFVGAGGRAELASEHPADAWPDITTEVWTVNPPGYGTSGGQASLQVMPRMARAAFQEMAEAAHGSLLAVVGNSLGTSAALFVAARFAVDGLLLRNPPPLRQLIAERHGWWNFGLSRWVARQVPDELCSITNARRVEAPALFVMSGQDRVVPPSYQRQIHEAYAGERQVMVLHSADHATPATEAEQPAYLASLAWLRQQMLRRHEQRLTMVR